MRFAIVATSLLLSVSSVYSQAASGSSSGSAASDSNQFTAAKSPACNTLINQLNADDQIKKCTDPLLTATQTYANATQKSGSDISTALTTSLGDLCGSNAGCDTGLIRTYLSQFWDACSDDIKNKNQKVSDVYDVLYLINPFREAICTKDAGQNYCLQTIASSAATSPKRSLLEETFEPLVERQASSSSGDDLSSAASAADDQANNNIAFLFLQPTAQKSVLCGDCAKNILASYISFETSIPYGVGLANSPILSGQSAIFKKAKSECGKDWRANVNVLAGTQAFTQVSGVMDRLKVNGLVLIVGIASAGIAALI